MLTEQFLNICAYSCLNDNKKINESVFGSIKEILNFYKNNFSTAIPLDMELKYSLILNLVDSRLNGKTSQTIVDSLSLLSNNKYDGFKDFIEVGLEKILSDDQIDDYILQINKRRKLTILLKNFNQLQSFVDDFSNNSFDNLEDALTEYDTLVSDMYSVLATEKRNEQVGQVASLDLLNDDFKNVIEQIEINYSGDNTVPTGYTELDGMMRGGYDPSRLYVIGGSSGDGKSTFLMNCVKNAIEKDTKDPNGLLNVYSYITLENLMDESLVRLYSCWSEQNSEKFIKNFKTEQHKMVNFIKSNLNTNCSNIEMKYFAPSSVSVFDLRLYIQSLKEKYKGKGRLRCVYIDYLDLLKSGSTFDLYRLELGQVTLLLKVVAVLENIPIVTVTQLNREGYDKEVFSLVQMSESIKKVEHSDFIGLLKAQEKDPNAKTTFGDLDFYIGKNRSGPKDKKITLRSDFSKFLIQDGVKSAGLELTNELFEISGDDVFI